MSAANVIDADFQRSQSDGLVRVEFAARIRGRAEKDVESYVATGKDLVAAKKALPHGEFESMVREDLGWDPSTARRFMDIAKHPVLSNRAHVHDLPTKWSTLAALAKVEQSVLEKALADGRITKAT